MTVPEAKRLKTLEDENAKLKKLVAGTDARSGRDEGTGFKKVVTPAVKREAVAHLKVLLGFSKRRACRIAGADRKMVRYRAQRAPDMVLRGRLRELANERRRSGIGGSSCCCGARANYRASTGSIGFPAKKG